MCDTNAYIVRNGLEEQLLESVDRVEFNGDEVVLTNIFGEKETLQARLRLIDNTANKLLFEPL